MSVKATGNNSTSSSGAVTTTNATNLLVAGNLVLSSTKAAGTGFTSRVITNPDDIAEDRVVTATRLRPSATAALNGGAQWIMQMVAFRAAQSGPDTQAPTAPATLTASATSVSQVNLSWSCIADNVGVTCYLIRAVRASGARTSRHRDRHRPRL